MKLFTENRVCPEVCHCIEMFFIIQDFQQLALAVKTQFALKFFKSGGGDRTPMSSTKSCSR